MITEQDHSGWNSNRTNDQGVHSNMTMDIPLFPLDTVLFPGMVLPLHIFEPRYREMINHCLDDHSRFGVVLIDEGSEAGGSINPHRVGTAARIARATHLDDGRMDITVVGTQRFRILEIDQSRSYLTAKARQYPLTNSSTRLATEMARKVRPQVMEYVELLSDASETKLRLDRLPEDPKALAILVAIALQISNDEKQRLLEIAGVPQMLDRERYLLSWETMLLRHMMSTQSEVEEMGIGSTGYLFPN